MPGSKLQTLVPQINNFLGTLYIILLLLHSFFVAFQMLKPLYFSIIQIYTIQYTKQNPCYRLLTLCCLFLFKENAVKYMVIHCEEQLQKVFLI